MDTNVGCERKKRGGPAASLPFPISGWRRLWLEKEKEEEKAASKLSPPSPSTKLIVSKPPDRSLRCRCDKNFLFIISSNDRDAIDFCTRPQEIGDRVLKSSTGFWLLLLETYPLGISTILFSASRPVGPNLFDEISIIKTTISP